MVRPVNPYVAGLPLREEHGFFGRQDALDWVTRELRNPATNALVLFGQRRIGKTSLLLQLQHALPTDHFLPIYFDLQDQATCPLGEILADLADNIAERIELEPPKAEAFDNEGGFFRHEFLPQLYQAIERDRRPVFLLDEFDVLDQEARDGLSKTAGAKRLFPFLRQLMAEDLRPAFVFVVGRRAEDLSLNFTATFKASLIKEIWILDRPSAEELVRQAEANNSLRLTSQAIDRILGLTNCHPYLTQLLCQRIWELAYRNNPTVLPRIDTSEVEAAIADALEVGGQALKWLWDGLSPAEKIYAAALAEIADEGKIISEHRVVQVLTDYAARLRTREVELAPRDLEKRRVLEMVSEKEYRFAVELFRRWVQQNKRLGDVKDELDRIEPMADKSYALGQDYFKRRNWKRAIRHFQEALENNPRHFGAHLHMGEALLELDQVNEAVRVLERAYELDRGDSCYALVRALAEQAKAQYKAGEENDALATCRRMLQLSPNEKIAREIPVAIWARRGDAFLDKGLLQEARDAYKEAGLTEKVDEIETQIHAQELAELQTAMESLIKSGQYEKALLAIKQLAAKYPDEGEWEQARIRVQEKLDLTVDYREALRAIEQHDQERARKLLTRVVAREPDYEEAIEHLLKAVKGIDVRDLEYQCERKEAAAIEAKKEYDAKLEQLSTELARETRLRESAESRSERFRKDLDKVESEAPDLQKQLSNEIRLRERAESKLNKMQKQIPAGAPGRQEWWWGLVWILPLVGLLVGLYVIFANIYAIFPDASPARLSQKAPAPQNDVASLGFQGYKANRALIEWTQDSDVETCVGSPVGISVDFKDGNPPVIFFNSQYVCQRNHCTSDHALSQQPIYFVTVTYKCGKDATITLFRP